MTHDELFAALRAPFAADAIEWRIGQSGKSGEKFWAKVLAYLTARAVMDRLDETIGPRDWKAEYTKAPHDPKGESVLCTLYLRIDGEWIGKADGASASEIEGTKGGISDSLKRAAVCWGIGRYLYSLGESFAETRNEKPPQNERDDWHYAKTKDGTFFWKAPQLPQWALPGPKTSPPPPPKAEGKLSAKDAKTVQTCLDILKEAETEVQFQSFVNMLKAPDSGVNKADDVSRVKREIFEVMKKHKFYQPQGNQAA